MSVGWGQDCSGCNLGTEQYFDWSSFSVIECEDWIVDSNHCNIP